MRRLALLLALLAFALPGYGQETESKTMTFKEVLSGTTTPLTMKLKDLNGDWRRMKVGGNGEGSAGYMELLSGMFSGGGGVYYTRGDTVTSGSETYVIAYRVPAKNLNFSELMRSNQPPPPEKLTPETTLTLSLLNQRTSGSFVDIRPFNLSDEISTSETAITQSEDATTQAKGTSSLSNLKQIGLSLLMYVQDYDEVLPPLKNPATVKTLLMPYVKNETVFINPITKTPYRTNPILSYHKLGHIAKPAEMIVFYEDSPAPDNTRGVAFLDGHARRIPESKWPEWKRLSKIP